MKQILVSKDTHFDRLFGTFMSPEEIEIDEKLQRDPWQYRGRSLNQVARDGAEPRVCFGSRVWIWEEEGFAKVDFLVEWRKEIKCKGIGLNRVWICKGGVIL